MNFLLSRLAPAALLLLAGAAMPAVLAPAPAAAQEIRQVINGTAVTNYDIQRRVAFLRVQQRRGNLQNEAAEEMRDQVLRSQEMRRLNIRISEQQLDQSYKNFADSNKLTVKQLDGILQQSGVTKAHFREFIRVQMGWGQAIQARASAEGSRADQQALRELAKRGGTKPSATEYTLQQFIFVVPERERRSIMGRRKNEANAMRGRVSGCENTRDLAKTVLDVTVRDLGRVLEPELPPDWEKQVKAASVGRATAARETPRGVEFLVICSTRNVDDDKVAEVVFQKEQMEKGDNQGEALSKRYTEELRKRARITSR
ncbi:MAG TPA: peptidylprolyl isomerase [Rhizobiaceae bacterium]|nr:peptidylprolyl isomerase [Rhizobiaceae bacterium]